MTRNYRISVCLAAIGLLFTGNISLRADEPLLWKFEPGQTLPYTLKQSATFQVKAGTAGNVSNTMTQTMQIEWRVDEVSPTGEAKITQSIRRIQIEMTMPAGPHYTFDTASNEPPMGLPSMIAELLKTMQEAPVHLTLNQHGEILNVEIPPVLMNELKKAPGSEAFDLASEEGIKRMAAQIAIPLPPGEIEPGKTWQQDETAENEIVGTRNVKTEYTYQGNSTGAASVAEISLERTITIEPQTNSKVQGQVERTATSGTLLFDRAAGRVKSSHLEQNVEMELLVESQKVAGMMTQTIDVSLDQ